MAWVEILPRFASLFRHKDWDSASSFLDWTGILVNRHRHRQVEEVRFAEPEALAKDDACFANASGSDGFFLKKEFAVTWRDRFRNAWHGFGWCATAVREAAILQALRRADIGCPEVVALGEDGRRAFVLTRAETDMTELREFLPTLDAEHRNQLADALGRELARMHDAGFEHPDLFAKHILAARAGESFSICILDWQRGRRRRAVPWRVRCRDLAILDATLHTALASNRVRLRCLRAYAHWSAAADNMPLARLAQQVRTAAERLMDQRHIREVGQLPTPALDQQFVPVCDGRILIVRSYFEKLGGELPDWLARAGEPDAKATEMSAAASATNLKLTLQSWPIRDSNWEIPPLAHTLFRLQRFGVSAPRLLAVGRCGDCVFLLAEGTLTRRFGEVLAKAPAEVRTQILEQAGATVRRIHEAGYHLPAGQTWDRQLGVSAGGEVELANVESLLRGHQRWQEVAPVELDLPTIRVDRDEQQCFLHGYLHEESAGTPERQTVS